MDQRAPQILGGNKEGRKRNGRKVGDVNTRKNKKKRTGYRRKVWGWGGIQGENPLKNSCVMIYYQECTINFNRLN